MIIEIIKITFIAYVFFILGETGRIFNFYQKFIERLPWWLRNPLGGCHICLVGQTLFWSYLILHIKEYDLIDHLFYPSFGILLAITLNYLYDKS